MERSLGNRDATFKFQGLVMGDSTDGKNMAELVIFPRDIEDKYEVTEKLATL